jgi:ribonuclease P protein component
LLPKKACLSKGSIRQTVRNGKQRIKSPLFALVARENFQEQSRLAVVVTRKTGNAVVRNRIKRIFKAAFIEIYYKIEKKMDMVVFPSSLCKDVKSGRIAAELSKKLDYKQRI